MSKLKLLIFISQCLFALSIRAQSKPNFHDIKITGRVVDPSVQNYPKQRVSVTIRLSKIATGAQSFPSEDLVQYVDSSGRFEFIIPTKQKRYYMYIYYSPVGGGSWSFIDNVYILEEGDSIDCALTPNFYYFTGKGAAKLQCQSEIYMQKDKSKISILGSDEEIAEKDRKLDSILALRISIVNSYSDRLGKELTDILLANCYGLRYYLWLRGGYMVSRSEQNYLQLINTVPYAEMRKFSLNSIDSSLVVQSPIYCDFLLEKIKLEGLRVNDWKTDRSEKVSKYIYDAIFLKHTGVMRDKLLTIFLLKDKHALKWLEETIPLIKNTEYKKVLNDMLDVRGKGRDFYPFKLENDKGDIVSLTTYKNKILVVDFWFTGCSPCMQLNEAMQPLFERYMTDSLVKFISINIDASKRVWLENLKTGMYTHHTGINLYAGGSELNTTDTNTIITYYMLKTFPTLFIVKNGRMYSSNPPLPLLSDGQNVNIGSTKKLIDLIEAARLDAN